MAENDTTVDIGSKEISATLNIKRIIKRKITIPFKYVLW